MLKSIIAIPATQGRATKTRDQLEAARAPAAKVPEAPRPEEADHATKDFAAARATPPPTSHPDAPRSRQASQNSGQAQRPTSAAIAARRRDGTWIDYELVEPALREAMGEPLRLIAGDHVHDFQRKGVSPMEVKAPDIIQQVADAGRSYATDFLIRHGWQHVISEPHLQAKLARWADFWCQLVATQAEAKGRQNAAEDEAKALILSRYGTGGGDKGRLTQKQRTDEKARRAQIWRAEGRSLTWIAEQEKVTTRTIHNWLKRTVEVNKRAPEKGSNCPVHTKQEILVPSTKKHLPFSGFDQPEPAPTRTGPQADPINADQRLSDGQSAEMEAIGPAIPDLLRALWAETDQETNPDPPTPAREKARRPEFQNTS